MTIEGQTARVSMNICVQTWADENRLQLTGDGRFQFDQSLAREERSIERYASMTYEYGFRFIRIICWILIECFVLFGELERGTTVAAVPWMIGEEQNFAHHCGMSASDVELRSTLDLMFEVSHLVQTNDETMKDFNHPGCG